MNAIALVPALDFREPAHNSRDMPRNLEAEQALIGMALFDNGAYVGAEGVRPEHFAEPTHGAIWATIADKINKNARAEVIGVAEALATHDGLNDLGGRRFLADLVDMAPPSSTAPEMASVILDLALRRELIVTAERVAYDARREPKEALAQLAHAERQLAELAHHGGAPGHWLSAGSVAADALRTARTQKGLVGLSTGLHELDDAIGGLRSGQMIVIGGRPGMAKSTAALQIAKAISRKGRGVCFFSMEMPPFDLGLRMACDVAHDPLSRRYDGKSSNPTYFDAARGKLDESAWWTLDQAREDIERWPLLFDDRPGLTVPTMLAASRRQFRAWERDRIDPGCIIVDHLTIARPDQDRKGNKVAEVGDISRGLAEMAKTLSVPVIALCQLSRDIEKGGRDKRPTLADLRWAGEIEQDARVVAFLYRPEYYVRPPEDPTDFEALTTYRDKLDKVRNKLFWLVEKNNNGPTTQVETYCDIACSAIRDKLGGGV